MSCTVVCRQLVVSVHDFLSPTPIRRTVYKLLVLRAPSFASSSISPRSFPIKAQNLRWTDSSPESNSFQVAHKLLLTTIHHWPSLIFSHLTIFSINFFSKFQLGTTSNGTTQNKTQEKSKYHSSLYFQFFIFNLFLLRFNLSEWEPMVLSFFCSCCKNLSSLCWNQTS